MRRLNEGALVMRGEQFPSSNAGGVSSVVHTSVLHLVILLLEYESGTKTEIVPQVFCPLLAFFIGIQFS